MCSTWRKCRSSGIKGVLCLGCHFFLSGCETTEIAEQPTIISYHNETHQYPPRLEFLEQRIGKRCEIAMISNLYLEVGNEVTPKIEDRKLVGILKNVNNYLLELKANDGRLIVIPLKNIRYISFDF